MDSLLVHVLSNVSDTVDVPWVSGEDTKWTSLRYKQEGVGAVGRLIHGVKETRCV